MPDLVTDQTSAHDPLNGYVPNGMTLEQARALRAADPDAYIGRGAPSHGRARAAPCSTCKARGSIVFDYGNNIRAEAQKAGVADAFDFPGFVPAYIRPLFCEGKGPFRWAASPATPRTSRATDEAVLEPFPDDAALRRWIRPRARAREVPGPARAHLLARLRRAREGGPRVQRAGAHRPR